MRRVSKSNGKLYWYGSGGDILAETNSSGVVTAEYIFFGGKRVAMLPAGGSAQFYIEDMLGTSRVITTNAGVVCYDADFYPYGGERAPYTNNCPATNNYKFEGKERDTETGNDDFGARYYSNRFGRWLSADWSAVPAPVPYANLTNPQTLNLYSMVADDPESFADLDGHEEDKSKPAELVCPTDGSHVGCVPLGESANHNDTDAKSAQQPAQNTVGQIISAVNGAAKETFNEAKSLSEMLSPLGPLSNALVPDLQPSNSAEKVGMIADAVVLAVLPIGGEAKAGEAVAAGDAGRFATLQGLSKVGDELAIHHMPQAAAGFTSRAEGGALVMEQAEHALTRTFRGRGVATARAEAGMSFRNVLARDIRDVRGIVGSKYNQGMQKLIQYYREAFPSLMAK